MNEKAKEATTTDDVRIDDFRFTENFGIIVLHVQVYSQFTTPYRVHNSLCA